MVIEQAAALKVAEEVVRFDFIRRLVSPGFRIADSNVECSELGLGFRFGRRIHPGQSLYTLAERGDNVRNHRLRGSLCFRREVALRVNLANRIAKQTLDGKLYETAVGTSTHYHAVYVHPSWRKHELVARIGAHIFYR